MGSLRRFVLSDEFVQRFPHFVETGTNWGESLMYAARHPFKTLGSCEVEEMHYNRLTSLAWDDRVKIVLGTSAQRLPGLIGHLPHDEGVLFWLDAHFPDGRTDRDPDQAPLCWPLVRELHIIDMLRPHGRDAILIDDWRLYSDEVCDKGPPDPPAMKAPPFVVPGPPPAWTWSAYFPHDEGYMCWLPRLSPILVVARDWQ